MNKIRVSNTKSIKNNRLRFEKKNERNNSTFKLLSLEKKIKITLKNFDWRM